MSDFEVQRLLDDLLAECQQFRTEMEEGYRQLRAEAEAAKSLRAAQNQSFFAERERQRQEAEAAQSQSVLGGEPMSMSNSDSPDRPDRPTIPEGPNLPTVLGQIAQQQQANAEAIGQLARVFAQFGERQSRTEAAVEALAEAVARLAESLSGLPRNGGG